VHLAGYIGGQAGKQGGRINGIKGIVRIAKLAVDLDAAHLFEHLCHLTLTQRSQRIADALTRATAAEGHRLGLEQAQVLFVEEAAAAAVHPG